MRPHSFNLGNNSPRIDSRDIHLGKAQAPTIIPDVFMQDNVWALPIFYQRQTPSCGAHAVTWLKMLLDSYDDTSGHTMQTPRFTWNRIRSLDGLTANEGSYFHTIFDVLRKYGTCDIDLLDNNTNLGNYEYAFPRITDTMLANAQPKILNTYALDPRPSFDQIKQAIYKNKAVVLLMEVDDTWWTSTTGVPSWAEADILPLRPLTRVTSRHYVVAHSYDVDHIYFANSFLRRGARKDMDTLSATILEMLYKWAQVWIFQTNRYESSCSPNHC